MTRQGKCANLANCLLAYRNETITISEGDYVCPECGQPLTPLEPAPKPASPKIIIPAIIIGGILGLVAISGVSLWLQARRIPTETKASATPTLALENQDRENPPSAETTPAADTSAEASPVGESSPTAISAPAKPNLDLQNAENQKVKAEVLQRIDLMPNISADNKDKLYVSVERARQMGRVMVIPFGSGKTALAAADVDDLKNELKTPALRQLMSDPTCVFVILGFADTKGDAKTNLRLSQERAQNALNTLRDKCDVINVMHAVAMGGSSLFDDQGVEKNRVAEIWAVLP